MTREEAQKILKLWMVSGRSADGHRGYIEGWFDKDDVEAFRMAIEALKVPTENTNTSTDTPTDLISRQAAINAIENTDCELSPKDWDELTDAIVSLPSAEPKIGEWIEVEKNEYEGFSIVNMRCNQCRKYAYLVLPKGTKCVYDFCPNCGAKMKGGTE